MRSEQTSAAEDEAGTLEYSVDAGQTADEGILAFTVADGLQKFESDGGVLVDCFLVPSAASPPPGSRRRGNLQSGGAYLHGTTMLS
jgi:hypothetical protein